MTPNMFVLLSMKRVIAFITFKINFLECIHQGNRLVIRYHFWEHKSVQKMTIQQKKAVCLWELNPHFHSVVSVPKTFGGNESQMASQQN